MANTIRLTVGGMEYKIVSDEDESYIRSIGDKLNAKLDGIKRENQYLSTTMVAVLAALDYCDDATKIRAENEQLRQQLKNAVEDAACARFEGEEARREIERLSHEMKERHSGQ